MNNLMHIDELISEELAHYGVPRKSGRYPWGSGENPYHHGNSSPSGKKLGRQKNREIRRERKQALKNRRSLSDKELNERISRLEKEKKFKNLTLEDISPGKKAVENALSGTGKKVLATVATGAALATAEYLIRGRLGDTMDGKGLATAYKDYARPKK